MGIFSVGGAGVGFGSVSYLRRGTMRWLNWLWFDDPVDPYPEIIPLSSIQVVHYIRELKRRR